MNAAPPAPRPAIDGFEALRRGDAAAARDAFALAIARGAEGPDGADLHVGLAYACVALKDGAAATHAVDAALARQPAHLRALMLKADLLHAGGDRRSAVAHYQAALDALPAIATLPPGLAQERARAAAMLEHIGADLGRGVRSALDGMAMSPRFAQSVELLLGTKAVYWPQPQLYHFPELPTVQFFDRAAFPWMEALEAQTAAIREELLGVVNDASAFTPYVERDAQRPALRQGGLLDNPDWSAYYLWKNGAPVQAHAARCPRTMAALAQVPLARVPGRSPSALFSQLRPGARIPPHHGFVNTRLIVHLPLVVPPGCGFRVGNETREWVEGRAWAFDDTIEHEAWNGSDRTRVVLLFEVWRPELTAAEREQVGRLFEAVDQLGAGGADWGI